MKPLASVRDILEKEHIKYSVFEHPLAFTALEIAEKQHIPGRELIKAVIIKVDSRLVMCVLPATHKVDFTKLLKLIKGNDAHLISEGVLAQLFPEFEVGAMPPFGHLAGLKVYIDKILEENEYVAFNAGSHREIVRIRLKDFLKLENPEILDFGVHI